MHTVSLKATPRTGQGKGPARRLRAEGKLPAIAYGGGKDTIAIAIESNAFKSILTSDRGRNTIIEMQVEGRENFPVMVKTYEVHPVSRRLLHADFLRVDVNKPVAVEVPFITVGKSKGEVEGGTLLSTVRSLRVRCLPAQIPDHIDHDVSELMINDMVKVKDLQLPPGTESLMSPDFKLVVVAPPRVETEKVEEGEAAEGEAGAEGDKAEGDKAEGDKAEGDKKD